MLLWFLADSIQIVVRGGVFEVLCTDVAASRTDVSHKSCQKDNEPHYIFVYGLFFVGLLFYLGFNDLI